MRAMCAAFIRACQASALSELRVDTHVANVNIDCAAVSNTFNEPSITLWASDMSAYMGLESSFQNRLKALGGVWKRTNEAQYRAVHAHWRANGCTLQTDAPARALHDPFPDVNTVDDVRAFCKSHLPADIMRLYKAKGRLCEEELAARFGTSIECQVTRRHASVTWRSDANVYASSAPRQQRPSGDITDPGAFVIVGEVDGCLTSGPYAGSIVEIKLRLQELREQIPLRDYMQIQTYLHLFNAESAFYVQGLFGTPQLLVKSIQRDRNEFQTVILPALQRFVCDVRRLLRGEPEDSALRAVVLQECNTEPLPAREFVPILPSLKPLTAKVWLPVSGDEADEKRMDPYFAVTEPAAPKKPKAAKRLPKDMNSDLLALFEPTYNLRSLASKRPRTRGTKM